MSEYASYLANLQNKAKVVATEDILSDKGLLLAKSGVELNKKTYNNILKFKLLKPLEDSIAISNQLNAKSVYDRIIQFVNTDIWLNAINNTLGNKVILQRCCLQLDKYPLLLQKLTVLSMEIPEVFDQAVLSAYLSHICGINNKEDQDSLNHYFLAGLSHDIGFLHIDRYILTKKEKLTAEEWRKIQSHPVIGYEILKRIDKFPKIVSRAVLEHHENLDGTGYPRSKTALDLSSLGQTISLVDNVIAIYNRKLKPLNQSLRNIIPIIQINMHSYFPNSVSLILRTLKQAPESLIDNSAVEIIKQLIGHVQAEQTYVKQLLNILTKGNQTIGFTHNNKDIYVIQNIASNIIMIANSAGLSDSSYSSWLEEADNSDPKALYSEVNDTHYMLEEVIYQLETYQKTTSVFINKNPDHEFTGYINEILQQFGTIKRPVPPQALIKYWDHLANKPLSA